MNNTLKFIIENIDKTVKTSDNASKTLVSLPYPYTTPCIENSFQEMYYWDTYFTNKGLLLLGKVDQVVNNINDFIYLIETYGYIPNGNRTYYLNRSQPPFFGLMLKDVLETCKDKIDVDRAIKALEKELVFWKTKRITPTGLSCYGSNASDEEYIDAVKGYNKRLGFDAKSITVNNGKDAFAECESGWDFSPRFSKGCTNYNPIDLNCLLYASETLLGEYSTNKEYYKNSAESRKNTIKRFLKAPNGVYYDYCYNDCTLSNVLSAAAFFPYFVGIETDVNGLKQALAELELPYGIVSCEKSSVNYQWGYPNGWAPLNYVAFQSALNMGHNVDALRIATKYVNMVDNLYEQTGKLWEKYNVENGTLDVVSEYGTPDMLGWSAGVYVVMYNYINKTR